MEHTVGCSTMQIKIGGHCWYDTLNNCCNLVFSGKETKAAYVGHKTDDLNVVVFESRLWMKQAYFK